MDSKEIRLILKKMHPNKVREIKNLVWFEDDNQKWVFEYSFIKKLSDESIAYRLSFAERKSIYNKALRIISINFDTIEPYKTKVLLKKKSPKMNWGNNNQESKIQKFFSTGMPALSKAT